MNIIKKIYFLSTIIFVGIVVSCNDKDETPDPLVAIEITNFEAPGDVYDYTTNPPVLVIENDMKYFDFSTEMEVTSSGAWDIGIKGTDIITNGGINGSGGVQATTISGIFDNLSEVPQGTSFASDTETANAINKNTDFEDLKTLLKTPVIFDGRNQYIAYDMEKKGFEYHQIGKK